VANTNQPLGQNVDQESTQELIGGNGHDLLLAAVRIVLPTKQDSIILESNESLVRDRDAMGVSREIMQNMFGPAEGWLGIDNPVLPE
jgi:hypothetical protein